MRWRWIAWWLALIGVLPVSVLAAAPTLLRFERLLTSDNAEPQTIGAIKLETSIGSPKSAQPLGAPSKN